jgi:hypothetical protein
MHHVCIQQSNTPESSILNPLVTVKDVIIVVPNILHVLKFMLRFCTTSLTTECSLQTDKHQMITLQQQGFFIISVWLCQQAWCHLKQSRV